MNDNQMKPLQALELLMTRLEPSKDNVAKARVEYETVKSALKEYELMKQTKFIVADKKISEDDLEKLKNQRMFVGSLEACEIKPLFDEETKKKLKALEIIKLLGLTIEEKTQIILSDDYKDYINRCDEVQTYGPIKNRKQYEILKEVLKND